MNGDEALKTSGLRRMDLVETIHLQTSLSVEECKNRLRSSAATGVFFPELQCKDLIGGIKGDRFWVQRSYTSIGFDLGWRRSCIPTLYGRLFAGAAGAEVVGHFGMRPLEWVVFAFFAMFAVAMAIVGVLDRDWGVLGMLAVWVVVAAVCIVSFKKRWQAHATKTLEFLMKTLQAEQADSVA